ncbi:hypothetical protein [Pseudodesulfovibrio indicus]|uniref:hypothetical protein n=1 Tax=Pseudodesulfovibrio indicus TaxID=1716143 RepID=UPI00293080AF|nr:hypothetical protein [Pseudodesulfovibrio indicus]
MILTGGGVSDGGEVQLGTNPLNEFDDEGVSVGGTYIVTFEYGDLSGSDSESYHVEISGNGTKYSTHSSPIKATAFSTEDVELFLGEEYSIIIVWDGGDSDLDYHLCIIDSTAEYEIDDPDGLFSGVGHVACGCSNGDHSSGCGGYSRINGGAVAYIYSKGIIDLDIDSDNDNVFEVPDRSEKEDSIEVRIEPDEGRAIEVAGQIYYSK